MSSLSCRLLSKAAESTAAATGIVASTARDLVVDLAVCELVDLVVVLVAKAGAVGQVVDLCRITCQRMVSREEHHHIDDLRVWAWPETPFSMLDCCCPPSVWPLPPLPLLPRASLALFKRLDMFVVFVK